MNPAVLGIATPAMIKHGFADISGHAGATGSMATTIASDATTQRTTPAELVDGEGNSTVADFAASRAAPAVNTSREFEALLEQSRLRRETIGLAASAATSARTSGEDVSTSPSDSDISGGNSEQYGIRRMLQHQLQAMQAQLTEQQQNPQRYNSDASLQSGAQSFLTVQDCTQQQLMSSGAESSTRGASVMGCHSSHHSHDTMTTIMSPAAAGAAVAHSNALGLTQGLSHGSDGPGPAHQGGQGTVPRPYYDSSEETETVANNPNFGDAGAVAWPTRFLGGERSGADAVHRQGSLWGDLDPTPIAMHSAYQQFQQHHPPQTEQDQGQEAFENDWA
jgi:hypothetical protein